MEGKNQRAKAGCFQFVHNVKFSQIKEILQRVRDEPFCVALETKERKEEFQRKYKGCVFSPTMRDRPIVLAICLNIHFIPSPAGLDGLKKKLLDSLLTPRQ